MRDILGDYANHCQRQGHAKVWSVHFDIWSEPQGELGMNYTDPDYEALAVFAAMVPWMLIPTIGHSWLVVDRTTLRDRWASVVELKASTAGLEHEAWHLSYSVADDASMTWGKPKRGGRLAPNSAEAIKEIFKGRMSRIGWEDEIDFDQAVMIADGLLS